MYQEQERCRQVAPRAGLCLYCEYFLPELCSQVCFLKVSGIYVKVNVTKV